MIKINLHRFKCNKIIFYCLERIKIRGRRGEENIKKEYLLKLKTKMDLLHEMFSSMGVPCLRLCNATGHLDNAVNEIENFINTISTTSGFSKI